MKGNLKKVVAGIVILLLCVIGVYVIVRNVLKKKPIVVEDLEWEVVESIDEGERILSFDYTNNTDYTILELEIKFVQKKSVTDEDRKVFEEAGEYLKWEDEMYKNAYLIARNSKCAEPGEKVSNSYIRLNGTNIRVSDMQVFDLMEPDIATITYIQEDKAHAMYYDFKTGKYTEPEQEGKEIKTWSDGKMASMLPKPNYTVVLVSWDKENCFSFEAFDVVKEDYKEYVEKLKQQGFSNVEYEKDNYYRLSNDDNIEVIAEWNAEEESMYVCIEKED